MRVLDENQNFALVRRSIISFFAKQALDCGYYIEDFQPCMKFVKDLYFEHCKNREEAQKL